MRGTTHPPRLDPIRLGQRTAGAPEELVVRADLEGLSFDDLRLRQLSLGSATVQGCTFSGVVAREADWKSTRFRESVLERLEIPVLRAPRGVWRDVRVERSRLGSVEAYETAWHSVQFTGCKLSFVNLRGAELLDVSFTDCVIEELDLVQTKARRVAFPGTRIARLNVQHGRFEHVDLRGADVEEIDGVGGLAGVTISSQQLDLLAPLLAQERGIKVD